MSNLLKYLPSPSEYATKVDTALEAFTDEMYVVGSAARKTLYGLGKNPKDYDFVLSYDDGDGWIYDTVKKQLTAAFPDKVKTGVWGSPTGIEVDCEAFTIKLRIEPIDKFLRSVRFAGDGLAVCVADDRPIVVPEFMSLPPVVAIIKTDDTNAQNNIEWLDPHLKVLGDFQNELYALVQNDSGSATKA